MYEAFWSFLRRKDDREHLVRKLLVVKLWRLRSVEVMTYANSISGRERVGLIELRLKPELGSSLDFLISFKPNPIRNLKTKFKPSLDKGMA